MQRNTLITIAMAFCLSLMGIAAAEDHQCLTRCHAEIKAKGGISHPELHKCAVCHGHVGPFLEGKGHGAPDQRKAERACPRCHKKEVLDDFSYLHGPLKEARCLACHTPHSSRYKRLLIDQYPQTDYVEYSNAQYRLCFRCHRRDLLMFPDTSFATGFRDHERNLHYLHVKGPKRGANCRMCHGIHGAVLPKLMAQKVSFGHWNMPVGFTLTPNGGACAPGCHDPKGYKR